ncbi:MAG: type I-E CRISPR-associated protein Cas7/Cse4/CasC [Chloroflexi bacterium RBG_13_53_26]|nr:MAG: type I-E CRISPR-associated protein Cas7/Cse4/CasC [Chloroflexi bacterium RBG_13_53_26]
MIIELHMLQNFAPSCLNRDDTNSPKECEFGGYRRARISSQCIKRAIRWDGTFREVLKGHLSSRSLKFPNQVYDKLLQLGVEQNINKEIGKGLEAIAKKEASKQGGEDGKEEKDAKRDAKNQDSYELDIFKTPQMVFYTDDEVSECANQIKALLDKGMKPAEILKKDKKGKFVNLPVFPLPHSADIGLFGRMVTSTHFDNVDAACQVAHAISTHKVGVEFDFYTAMDDLKKPEEEPGAGMMGTVEFNSACFYRYANIDCAQLKKNLGDDKELAQKTVEAFIRAAVNAIPTGKQNSFAAQNPPSFVFAVARTSGTWSLANAFASPVWVGDNGDLVQKSTDVLLDYWGKLVKVYNDKDIKVKTAFALDSLEMKGLDDAANLEGLIDRVNQAIAADC